MSRFTSVDTPSWYAIRTHPKQESRADENLKAWRVETFFPRTRDCSFNELIGEPSYFIKPLFPGYLFARFALSRLLQKVRFTRGVHSVVCIGSDPALVRALDRSLGDVDVPRKSIDRQKLRQSSPIDLRDHIERTATLNCRGSFNHLEVG